MNVIVIWNFKKTDMRRIAELNGHNKEISCLLFDNSDTLISAGGDEDH